MRSRDPKVLFFTKSNKPTEAELDAAMAISPGVQFRVASMMTADLETADAVAGAIPKGYTKANGYTRVSTREELLALAKRKVDLIVPPAEEFPLLDLPMGADIDGDNAEPELPMSVATVKPGKAKTPPVNEPNSSTTQAPSNWPGANPAWNQNG